MAGVRTHEELAGLYPGATSVKCNGRHIEVLSEGEKYPLRAGECPVCIYDKTVAAAAAFTPPRFRGQIGIPGALTEWALRGRTAQGIYITGPVGTGKTHAAWRALGIWCAEAGIVPRGEDVNYDMYGRRSPTVIFTRMTDLLDDLRPGDDARVTIQDCQKAFLLALDDIGAEKSSEWTQERIYSVIDHRYANCLPLIVTSNLPPSGLAEQIGDRAASRLAEMCQILPLTGSDRRMPS